MTVNTDLTAKASLSGEVIIGQILDPEEVEFRRRYEEDIKRGNMYNIACTLSGRLRSLDKKTRKTNERADRLEDENKKLIQRIKVLEMAINSAQFAFKHLP